MPVMDEFDCGRNICSLLDALAQDIVKTEKLQTHTIITVI